MKISKENMESMFRFKKRSRVLNKKQKIQEKTGAELKPIQVRKAPKKQNYKKFQNKCRMKEQE